MSVTASPGSTALPSRATTGLSSHDDAVPDMDPTTTAGLLAERLQAWKHAVSYVEEYMAAVEKIHGRQAKEYEKALKTISNPLREGQHFDQSLGGVAGFLENMRSNTQALINTNLETEKSIRGSVLPMLERLRKEIKHKAKELHGGAQSSAKEVDRLRNATQKYIELLGQQMVAFDSAGGRLHGHDDPHVVVRGVVHRLANQVVAENNHHNDLVAVQSNFKAFEAHVLAVLQRAVEAFVQLAGGQGDRARALYGDMLATVQAVPGDFEWNSFAARASDRLANPADAPRSVDAIQFPNMDHASTKPLVEGSLERKSRNKLSWGYSTAYYVVTPARFLHEFRDSDDTRQDPRPELSIYLPDAVVGAPSGDKFNVKGKDRSKTLSGKLAGSSELAFKAHSPADAQKWFHVIQSVCGATGPAAAPGGPAASASASEPGSPALEAPPGGKLERKAPKDHEAQDAGVTAVTGADKADAPPPAAEEDKKPAEAA